MKNTAFHRAKTMMAAISAILSASGGMTTAARTKIDALSPYKSHGKGRGSVLRIYSSRNKFAPHQGAKECARRVRQGLSEKPLLKAA